jgi:adenine/guanine/hypoxanthine permease
MTGFLDDNQMFKGGLWAYITDGLSIMVGALMGTSPVTVYIESSTGIREGGRTGLTALTTAFWFFIALWFTPILGGAPTSESV